MKVIFKYDSQEIKITPIEIRFYQKEHSFGQLYLIVPLHTETPKRVIINDMFDGLFCHEEKLPHYTVMYFANKYFEIKSNKLLSYDAYTNEIRTKFIEHTCNNILELKQKVKKFPYREIQLVYSELRYNNELINHELLSIEQSIAMYVLCTNFMYNDKSIIVLKNPNGYKTKVLNIDLVDMSMIKYYFAYFSSTIINEIKIPLYTNIKLSDLIYINGNQWTVICVEHYITNTEQYTILNITNRPQDINIVYNEIENQTHKIYLSKNKQGTKITLQEPSYVQKFTAIIKQ